MTASFADQEIWHVMIARDDLKRMNVDQLDDAFRLDIVDASTLVWKQGMDKWRRLGSIAGIDEDEPETIAREPARPFGPPSAPPPPRPRPVPPARSVAPAVNPFAATVQPHAVNPFAATVQPHAVSPFAATTPYASSAPAAGFRAPQGRVQLDSADLNFHGKTVHWGRWLVGLVLLTAGVLAAYRQNYLREGARTLGLENKYLYGEKRAVGWVTANAPGPVQAALRQLQLLPASNMATAAALTPAVAPSPPPSPEPSPQTVTASSPTPPPASDPSLKTVSLDSLPVLGAEHEASAEPAAPTPKARAVPPSAPTPKVTTTPAKKAARAEPAPKPAKAKAEPAPKAEPKAAKAPPPTMSSPLKAAIWQAMQEDSKKGK